MTIFMPNDDREDQDVARTAALLKDYNVEAPSADFQQRIIDEAALYPRKKDKQNPLNKVASGLIFIFFSKEARPMMLAFVMFVALLFSHVYEANRTMPLPDQVNDYASIMWDEGRVQLANTEQESFSREFSEITTDMMIYDFDQHFDI